MKNNLERMYPALSSEWSEKNSILPSSVTAGSHKKAWWKGKCGHEWEAVIKNRVRGSGCPYCSSHRVLAGFNDFATRYPEPAKEWSDRNLPLLPTDITGKNNNPVWWRCSNGHEWQARPADRAEGHGCPYCNGKVLEGYNDLFTTRPDLESEWSEKNTVSPDTISEKSIVLAFLKCRICGHEWQARVVTKANGTRCPHCRNMESREHYRELIERRKTKRSILYSVPLTALRYYLDQSSVSYITDDDSLFGIPVQIYIPEKRVVIETPTRKRVTKQDIRNASVLNHLCFRTRIKLIRIIPPDGTMYDNCLCVKRLDGSAQGLTESLQAVFSVLHLDIDVDVERDLADIMRFV
ncbi:MAG: zinc-ribbon domain-containing protein [Lachnospiraceae bacterium]|nr:zinc-ribbon domain-containing protein [Lachnospiraceae bacterium]